MNICDIINKLLNSTSLKLRRENTHDAIERRHPQYCDYCPR